ncbi:MAG: Bug family tripartite tricarboxylate transporter substrate binding protein [Xanthobacteraceae bacterium]
MFIRRALLAALAVVCFVALDRAEAQNFPDKLIKIVVPYPPGGPSDVAARLVAQPLSTILGQSVIVENIAGAGGRIGAKAVAQASPDGYTLFLGGTNPNAIAPSIYPNLTFEPMKDFRAVGIVSFDSNVLVVNAAVPVKTIQELLQYSKDNPGKLSSGATLGIGPHVSLELLRARTGSSMNFIPYRGAAPAINDLLGNQIQVGMSSKAVMLPLINSGRLRGLAVTSDDRWPELPDVPTMRESKFEGIPALLWSGLLAPARTPDAVIDKLNTAMIAAMKTPSVQTSLAKLGLKTKALTPQQFDAVLAEEARIWEAAVKESKMKLD